MVTEDGPNPMTGVCRGEGRFGDSQRSREETEAEIKVLPLPPRGTRDCWQPPKPGRGKEGSFLRVFRGSEALPPLWYFQPPKLWEDVCSPTPPRL